MKTTLIITLSFAYCLIVKADLLSNYKQDILQIVERPHASAPLLLIDKERWLDLSKTERHEIISYIQGPLFESSGCGNGGHLLQCEGKEPVLLDYFEATLPTLADDFNFINLKDFNLIEYFTQLFTPFPNFKNQFTQALMIIGPPSSWIISDLKRTSDTNKAYYISETKCKNSKLQQVAIRQNHTVYVDRDLFNTLPEKQRQLLYIHEVLYYLGQKSNNINSSELIRQIIRQALQQKSDYLDKKIIRLERIRLLLQSLMGNTLKIRYDLNWLWHDKVKALITWLSTPVVDVKQITDVSRKYSCIIAKSNSSQKLPFDIIFNNDSTLTINSNKKHFFQKKYGVIKTTLTPTFKLFVEYNDLKITFHTITTGQLMIKMQHNDNKTKQVGICQ